MWPQTLPLFTVLWFFGTTSSPATKERGYGKWLRTTLRLFAHLLQFLLWRLPSQVKGQSQCHIWKDLTRTKVNEQLLCDCRHLDGRDTAYTTNTVNASGAHVYTSPQYPKKQRHSLGLAELRHGTHAGQTWHLWNMQPQLSLHSRTIKRRSTLVIWSEQKQQEVLVVNPISRMMPGYAV